jgi:hypothetical protein
MSADDIDTVNRIASQYLTAFDYPILSEPG